ncbi:O-antigen ligase family protein [Croceitalea sp. P059]|uniref:O-antigen ligase family protein n=1 Tax=Croceitalea sp. P059 TaxID=3075601 RepID=UPI002884AC8B|nr:O-antigen ligase family protein [Croceitalea sp. P059]MDT0538723.1 O-antigen ligase family protein [Croceitalea sp. P059]
MDKNLLLGLIEKQFLFLFPLTVIFFSPTKYFLGTLSLPDIFIYVQLVVFIFYALLKNSFVLNKATVLFVVLIIFSFITLVINESIDLTSKFKYQLRWYNYFFAFLFTINYINNINFGSLKKGVYLATFLVCIYGIVQTVFIKQMLFTIFWIDNFPDYITQSFRTYSTFDNPLNLCSFLAFPLGLLQYEEVKKLKLKVLLVLIYATLILTGSKIALVLILVTFLIYFKKHIKTIIYSLIAALLVFFVLSKNLAFQELVKTTKVYERISDPKIFEGSLNQRKYMLEASIQMMKDNPIWGIGYENFGKVYLNGYKNEKADNDEQFFTAENFFLDFHLDNGLIPLLIILLFLAGVFLIYYMKKDSFNSQLTFPIILYLITGMIMSARSTPLLFTFFFFLAAYFRLKPKMVINL